MLNKYLCGCLIALLLSILAACEKPPPEYKEQFFAFGSLVEINLYGVEPERARVLLRGIGKELDRMHHQWSPEGDGELGRLNAGLSEHSWLPVSPELAALIQRSRELSLASGGLLDPAMGRMIKLWGLSDDPPKQTPPADAEIKALLKANPRMNDIKMTGNSLSVSNHSVRLDFGAIAQGYAVDWIAGRLHSEGVQNAIINVSGDLRILGRHGDRPWRIGIKNPRSAQGDILASLDIHDNESIVTSGDYERFYLYQGRRYHHIIDPRTGYPSKGLSSVTVLADNATLADAASTTLMINGVQGWHALAQRMGLRGAMLVEEDGTVHTDPAMAKRLEFESKPGRIELSAPL